MKNVPFFLKFSQINIYSFPISVSHLKLCGLLSSRDQTSLTPSLLVLHMSLALAIDVAVKAHPQPFC